jgi:prophage regulatory protein
MEDTSMESNTLIDFKKLKEKGVPYAKSRLWQLEQEHKFPRRVRLSAVRVAWVEAEIDKWIKSRIAARSNTEAA